METERPKRQKVCNNFGFLLRIIVPLVIGLTVQAQEKGALFSLTGKQIPIKEIIYQIRQQTGFTFFFSNELLNAEEKIDVDFQNAKLGKVLKTLFDIRGFYWVYRDGAIVLIPKKKKESVSEQHSDKVDTATAIISGVVTNITGTPLSGASVYHKESGRGATTDRSGRFSIPADNATTSLMVSCVGYQPQTVVVKMKQKIAIRLQTLVNSLDETIVIGYGSISKRMLTGAVSRVTGKEIARQPIANALQALQGTVTGLNVLQVTGLPGSDYRVELRGRNSIGSGNTPLYIIDGVPFPSVALTWDLDAGNEAINPTGWRIGFGSNMSYNILNTINPLDIESMEILKDADATTIYGSRGANGVVLISTKRGAIGLPKATINIYQGIGRLGHGINYLNTEQYLSMRKEAFQNDGMSITPEDYDLALWDSIRYTNWQKALIGGTARISNIHATLSGGTTRWQYGVSGGYRKETTVFPGSFNYQRGSLRTHLSYSSLNQRLKANVFASYTNDFNKLLQQDLTFFSTLPPNAPDMFGSDGNLVWPKGINENPYAHMLRRYDARTTNLSIGSSLNAELLPGLEFRANIGLANMHVDEKQVNPVKSMNPAYTDAKGFSYFGDTELRTFIAEPQLHYRRDLGKGKLDVLIGATFQQDLKNQKGYKGTGYTNDDLLKDMNAAPQLDELEGTQHIIYRYNAAFARIFYSYKDKYIFNLTGRRDGSSRFRSSNPFANFGAIGVGWIFSEESWMRRAMPFLSFGKLRASYGLTGNDQINDYAMLERYIAGPPYQGLGGLYTDRLFNRSYAWEYNRKFEVGLELGWIKDRLLLRTSYYNNRSSNQIVKYPISAVSGFKDVLTNIPAIVANNGVEIELKTINFQSRHFVWTSTLNLTLPQNKLKEFPGLESTSYNAYFSIGHSLDQFKGYHFLGVDPKTGIAQFEDMNKDGKLSALDKQYTVSLAPRYYGGMQQNFTFKNWQLDLLFQFVGQNGYNYDFVPSLAEGPGFALNQPVSVLRRWQEHGDITDIQKFSQFFGSKAAMTYAANLNNSNKMITDASFIRLKSLNLAYLLPEKWTKRWRIEGSRVYIQGQNLFTITRYPGRDPENASLPNANAYPPLRIWTAGVQFSF